METRDRLVSQLINSWYESIFDHADRRYHGGFRLATDEDYLALGFGQAEVDDGDLPLVFVHDDGTFVEVELDAFATVTSKAIRDEKVKWARRAAKEFLKAKGKKDDGE